MNLQKQLEAAEKRIVEIGQEIKAAEGRLRTKGDEIEEVASKLDDAQKQRDDLISQVVAIKKNIVREKFLPLVAAYNKTAAELAEILKNIYRVRAEVNDPPNQEVVIPRGSGWKAIDEIPSMAIKGEETPAPEHFFQCNSFLAELAKESGNVNAHILQKLRLPEKDGQDKPASFHIDVQNPGPPRLNM